MSTPLTKTHADEIVMAPKIIATKPDMSVTYWEKPIELSIPNIKLLGRLALRYFDFGFSLNYCDKRIRGINYEERRENLDGSIIFGWHEHLWNGTDDYFTIEIKGLPSDKYAINLEDLFDFCAQR